MDGNAALPPAIAPYGLDDEEIAVARREREPRVNTYTLTDPRVVLGRGSRPELELHLDRIAADGMLLQRRRGGGCAVVLDPGNLIVSLALPLPGLGGVKTAFSAVSDWLIAALTALGYADVAQRGVSDLAQGDRKVGGSCVYRAKDLFHYSTTLLVAPDLLLVERYLRHPPREPDYRRGRSHRDFMGRLLRAGEDQTPQELAAALIERLDPMRIPGL
jgi:lipoate-protein ligase A